MSALTDYQNKALSLLEGPPPNPFIVLGVMYENDPSFLSTFLFDRFMENWILGNQPIDFFNDRIQIMELLNEPIPEAVSLYRTYQREIFEFYLGDRTAYSSREAMLLIQLLKLYSYKASDIFEEIHDLISSN